MDFGVEIKRKKKKKSLEGGVGGWG